MLRPQIMRYCVTNVQQICKEFTAKTDISRSFLDVVGGLELRFSSGRKNPEFDPTRPDPTRPDPMTRPIVDPILKKVSEIRQFATLHTSLYKKQQRGNRIRFYLLINSVSNSLLVRSNASWGDVSVIWRYAYQML